jgi:lipopolysaccharide biosynthesis glycosyltransferase
MKYHAITAGYGPYERIAKILAYRFQKINQIETTILTNEVKQLPLRHHWFFKAYLWQYIPPDTDFLIYFDADILALNQFPKPTIPSFYCVKDPGNHGAKYGLKFYCNAGFFIAHKSTQHIFKEWQKENLNYHNQYTWHDQCALNIILAKNQYTELPKEYNLLRNYQSSHKEIYNLHFAGNKRALTNIFGCI